MRMACGISIKKGSVVSRGDGGLFRYWDALDQGYQAGFV